MNIFYLDKDPIKSARYHHDKHVVKMILESAQLLSTAHRMLDGEFWIDNSSGRKVQRWNLPTKEVLYKATHMNHPSNKWARESKSNYEWLYQLFNALCIEYTHRYNKVHLTQLKLDHILKNPPKNIQNIGLTKMPQAMPEQYRCEDSVEAYRNYYRNEKMSQSKYTNREIPEWLK